MAARQRRGRERDRGQSWSRGRSPIDGRQSEGQKTITKFFLALHQFGNLGTSRVSLCIFDGRA
jgi:hypothetical protein